MRSFLPKIYKKKLLKSIYKFVNNFNNQLLVLFLIERFENKIKHLFKYGFKNWYLNKKNLLIYQQNVIYYTLIINTNVKKLFEIINNLI